MFKLLSGEEVIGEIVEENSEEIRVNSPCIVVLQQQPGKDQPGVQFFPYTIFNTKENEILPFNRSCVLLLPYDVRDDLKNAWNQMFGSGLIVPKNTIVKG